MGGMNRGGIARGVKKPCEGRPREGKVGRWRAARGVEESVFDGPWPRHPSGAHVVQKAGLDWGPRARHVEIALCVG